MDSVLLLAAIACLVLEWIPNIVSGHGRLIEPPSRSTMWRFNFNNPRNYNDMELFCGGFYRQYAVNGGKCGICGDAWDHPHPRPNEAGGKYANGKVVSTYDQGGIIQASVELTAHHKGYFEFRVCPAPKDPMVEVTQKCLDKHLLEQTNGAGSRYYLPVGSGNGVFTIPLQLPKHLRCERCVFQWIYKCGNNWGVCENGTASIGCGNQEEFRGCADITILPSSFSEDTTTTTILGERPSDTTTTTSVPTTHNWDKPSGGFQHPQNLDKSSEGLGQPHHFENPSGVFSQPHNWKKPSGAQDNHNQEKLSGGYPHHQNGGRPSSHPSHTPLGEPAGGHHTFHLFWGISNNAESPTLDVTTTTTEANPQESITAKIPVDVPSSTLPSLGESRCRAVGVWKAQPAMKQWCINNCMHIPPYCPATHCTCA